MKYCRGGWKYCLIASPSYILTHSYSPYEAPLKASYYMSCWKNSLESWPNGRAILVDGSKALLQISSCCFG